MKGTELQPRTMKEISLRSARASDVPATHRLLEAAGLPLDGLDELFESAYVVAVSKTGDLVGLAGAETHGRHALLRSVVVTPALRGHGVGEALVTDRLAFAMSRGLNGIHLLTTTAADYFERLGFASVNRAELPGEIRASVEFTKACPETATAMSQSLLASASDELREEIRARYALAARAARSGPSSCGGTSSSGCCGSPAERAPTPLVSHPEGLGYDARDVSTLPQEAVQASLGCGNPLALAELQEGETVLDLGSGGGIDVLLSARRVGPNGRAYGVDMTDEMLDLARENQRAAGVANATFLRGTIESVPLPDASVDVVISNCVINLSTDKAKTLAEAHRVLKPGGRFAVADIVTTTPMPPAAQRAVALWAGCVAGAMTLDEYKRMLADAGFVDVEIEPLQNLEGDGGGCCGGNATEPELAAWDGKVLSAFVRAVKPHAARASARTAGVARAAVLLAVLSVAAAASAAPGDVDRVLEASRGESHAMRYVDHLSNKIGPRLTGSDGLARASAWAKDRFASFGLAARLEEAGTFPIGFDRGASSGEMIEPVKKPLHFGTAAWSAGTQGAVRAPARRAPANAAQVALQSTALPGAWILTPRPGTPDESAAHASLVAALESNGVAGLVFPAYGDRILASGDATAAANALPSVPRIELYESEWNDLVRRVDAGESVVLAFDLRHRFTKGPRPIVNVVSEIRGTTRPDEIVLIGAHLDSWDIATGATDNAVGVASTLEAARLLKKAGVKPARTIRFVLFTGEEQGLIGSSAYASCHAEEMARTTAVLIQDAGAGAISGLQASPALAAELEPILAPLRSLDASRPFTIGAAPAMAPAQLAACMASCSPAAAGSASCSPSASCATGPSCETSCAPGAAAASCAGSGSLCPSDHVPFLRAGVPSFLWQQSDGPSAYTVTHHTDLDGTAHVRAGDVEHSAKVVALTALRLADHARLLPREEAAGTGSGGGAVAAP